MKCLPKSLIRSSQTPPLRIARRIDIPSKGFADARHGGEEPATPMYSEVPSIDQRRHTHCDDEPRRPSRKQPPRMAGSLSIAFGLPSRPLRRNRNPFFWTAGHPARAR